MPSAGTNEDLAGPLALILETALDAVVLMRADGRVAGWNGVAETTFGWTRDEAVGRLMSDLIIPPQHRAAHIEGIERFLATGKARVLGQRLEITALRRDGVEFPVELSINLTRAAGEQLFVGFLRDISGRRQAEERLARQAREAELLFHVTRAAAEAEEPEAVLRQTLAAISALTGWPVGHVLLTGAAGFELSSSDIWHDAGDADSVRLREATGAIEFGPGVGLPGAVLLSGEPGWIFETETDARFLRKGLGYASAFAFPVTAAGRIVAVLEFFTHLRTPPDEELLLTVRTVGEQVGRVLERHRAIAELRLLNDTLEQRVHERTQELVSAQDQLRQAQKMEAIGQLTGGVAHDFNNLLTIIRSSVDLLRLPDLPERRRGRYLEAIADTADRAAKLTAQLLAFARRQALKPETFDAAGRLRHVADMIRTVLGSRIELDLAIDCADCFIHADIAQFETALINIAVNARDAMDGEGTLRVAAARVETAAGATTEGDNVAIALSDTGRGIAPELLGQVFEPFFTTKEVGKGTGLGLSQVYGFARQSGGDVRVESEVGVGTTFTLYLPRVEPPPTGDGARPEAPARPRGEPLRILVVEDNEAVGEFARQLLEEIGHDARRVPGAAEALRVLEREAGAFDLVFTDVVMAGMNGIDLAHLIRDRWPRLRIVLTSGYSHVLARQGLHGFELLQKPYAMDSLTRAIDGG